MFYSPQGRVATAIFCCPCRRSLSLPKGLGRRSKRISVLPLAQNTEYIVPSLRGSCRSNLCLNHSSSIIICSKPCKGSISIAIGETYGNQNSTIFYNELLTNLNFLFSLNFNLIFNPNQIVNI